MALKFMVRLPKITERSDVMIICLNFVKIFVFGPSFGLNTTLYHLFYLYGFPLFNLIGNTIAPYLLIYFVSDTNFFLNTIIILKS